MQQVGQCRPLRVDLDDARAKLVRQQRQLRRRVDHAARPHHQHDITAFGGAPGVVQNPPRQRFAKPDHAGSHGIAAREALGRLRRAALLRGQGVVETAAVAVKAVDAPVEVQRGVGASAFMQVVYILGDEGEVRRPPLQVRQRQVAGVGLRLFYGPQPRHVPLPDQPWLQGEAFL